MKLKYLFTLLFSISLISSFCQKEVYEFTFSALNNTNHIQLDSIKIMNRSQGTEVTIYWPDTNISLEISTGDTLLYIGYADIIPGVGIEQPKQLENQFHVLQNYPNPVVDRSTISMYIPENGIVGIMLTDIRGNVLLSDKFQLKKGQHKFNFIPGSNNLYFFTVSLDGMQKSIKILVTNPNSGQKCAVHHIGRNIESLSKNFSANMSNSNFKESGIIDNPEENKTYIFQFTDNSPCPGIPTVTYGGQVYSTVQILSQCWLKENLNIGSMVNGDVEMQDNGIIEKYCYDDHPDSCSKYGGLYQWEEMMQYTTSAGAQGICPPGWHIPTDDEWKILEGAVDSQYGIGDPEWDLTSERGYDANQNLKSDYGWYALGFNGTDLYGFTGLPAGQQVYPGDFIGATMRTSFWTSSEYSIYHVWAHSLRFGFPGMNRFYIDRHTIGFSVRCIKDN